MALYCQFWGWAQSHIIEKGLKRKTPRVGHCESTGSVVLESGIPGVVATTDDLSPDVVFWHVMDSCAAFLQQFTAKTSAAFAVARRESGILNQSFISALAATEPHFVLVAIGTAPQHRPPSVLFSSDIDNVFSQPILNNMVLTNLKSR
jgi:hypothetical protein